MSNDAMDIDGATPDAMDVDTTATTTTALAKQRLQKVTVAKPIPYTFDLGNLLCNDANPLPPVGAITEQDTKAAARDCAQALLNQLLSTCPINKSDDSTSVTLALPAPTTLLPREKPIPADKPLTKWQQFAAKKGIKDKKRGEGKLVFDEASGEWLPKYGYKGKNRDGENDWLVEVDEKKEKASGEHDVRKEKRAERKDRVKRNERRMRSNEKRNAKPS